MRIGDDCLNTARPPPDPLSKKLVQDRLGLGRADLNTKHFVSTVGVDAHRLGDNSDNVSNLKVCGSDPQIGPFPFKGPVEKGLQLFLSIS